MSITHKMGVVKDKVQDIQGKVQTIGSDFRDKIDTVSRTKRGRTAKSIFLYAGAFALFVAFLMVTSNREPELAVTPSDDVAATVSLNNIIETNVIANVASAANLPVASNTANIATSMMIVYNSSNVTSSSNKPQVIVSASRDIKIYRVQSEDTLESIAKYNGVTMQTLRWANGLKDDKVMAGTDIMIPAVDGVVYTVKDGDTVEGLASKYQANLTRLVAYNNLELRSLETGERIIIPEGVLPEKERPEYKAPVVKLPRQSSAAGNTYIYGYCTWYAYNRRVELGLSVENFWGNASTWVVRAQAAGYATGSEPKAGAIMQNGGGEGHVAIVEAINSDGSITISEMNTEGWNVKSYRQVYRDNERGGWYSQRGQRYTFIY
ncbi:MAG: LysM peptidoglycan-binding domain-containing protein [Candidatus Nomurabacteria bacterium]|nr:LysM peptidoglycan-binding domain-containing protein [Candidatus Nomurabacteria bacterium]